MSRNRQIVVAGNTAVRQCQRPSGWLGRFVLWRMNASHSKLTDWALAHIAVENRHTILDVGCGGGGSVYKLAHADHDGEDYGGAHYVMEIASTAQHKANLVAVVGGEIRRR